MAPDPPCSTKAADRVQLHEARGEVSLTRADGAAGEDKENARGRADEERGPAAERPPHAEQRAAAPPNSIAALGSNCPEDAALEHEEHAAAPATRVAGAKSKECTLVARYQGTRCASDSEALPGSA